MPPVNTDLLFKVLDRLEDLPHRFVLLGGSIVGLLVDHPELMNFRPTKDVDVLVEAMSRSEYTRLEEELRAHGFRHDISEGAPICRWLVGGSAKLDVLPLDSAVLGFGSEWFKEAWEHAQQLMLEGRRIELISPVYLIATKIAAFENRGNRDFWASHDLEDLVVVIDGRANMVEEVRQSERSVRRYIALHFSEYIKSSDFLEALCAYLDSDPASQERLSGLQEKIREIAALQ
jgi:hypothetical protein